MGSVIFLATIIALIEAVFVIVYSLVIGFIVKLFRYLMYGRKDDDGYSS